MELIYSMRRKALKCEPPQFESVTDHDAVRPMCTISNANIIAFSSPTELTDSEGDTWGGHVYVCDLDTPWDTHKVTTTTYPISVLEWDLEGKQLLVATTVGEVSVYTHKDYLLNHWTCLYSANISGEHIISALFFHNGRRVIALDKKPDAPITDRLQLLRSTPTLKGFGGTPLEGALVITATGLIGAITPPASSDSTQAQLSTDCLKPSRDHITAACMAHKNGAIVVAALCGRAGEAAPRLVRAARCSLRVCPPAVRVHVSPLAGVPVAPHDAPVSISWWHREEPGGLLVAGGALGVWQCADTPTRVHKLLAKGPLQGSTTPGGGTKPGTDCVNTLTWQKAWSLEAHAGAVGAACARSPLGAQVALLATQRALHLVANDGTGHRYLCSRAVITTGGIGSNLAEAATTPPKKAKYGSGTVSSAGCAVVSHVQLSEAGGVAVVVDTHAQLHVYKIPQPWADIPTPVSISHASSLLECALVSGLDCLDVLMALKQSHVEPVYERLTETFQRQPATFQQYYFHSWLKLRIALCRLIPSAQCSVSWLTCLQSLQSAWAAVLNALRHDDKLPDLLDDHDMDKSLLSLESKCDALMSEAASLSPLRLPLQRALDISLTALMSLCQHQHLMHHSYELWADNAALQLMRKLCGVARVAGRTADPLVRVLAKLAACTTPKPELIEECATLTSQWTGARVWESLPRCSVSAPHGKSWPLFLEYGIEPESLRYNPEPPAYAQCETTPSVTMDSIRYMHLGGGGRPRGWRACGRCGARALAAPPPARAPALLAHDARFISTCRCGGRWTLFSNV